MAILLATMLAAGIGSQRALGSPDKAAAFLAMIEGAWSGRAEITPVGARPYDMVLARTERGQIEGTADPGRSLHTWTFFAQEGRLRLSFLTTFGGNRDPIQFHPAQWTGDLVSFSAVRPDYLEVKVRPDGNRLDIDIFLRGRLHVSIRLKHVSAL
ncbi:MAG: hypothetical protein ACREC6_09075 [Hyphomicrobiaceae bacterium]